MSPYTKGAVFLIRLIGSGCIILSLSLLAGDVVLYMTERPVASTPMLMLKGLPFVAGIVICWTSLPAARRLTQDLEDE